MAYRGYLDCHLSGFNDDVADMAKENSHTVAWSSNRNKPLAV